MEYVYNLPTYQKLHEKYPNNIMLQICIDNYESYLKYYMDTGNYKYKIYMNIISSQLELFIRIEEVMET